MHHSNSVFSLHVAKICNVGVRNIPTASKKIEREGENVIVDESRVDGEDAHHEDDVATIEDGGKHLPRGKE